MQTLPSLITDYLEAGKYEKQLSPDMIKAYRIDLRQFVDFTEGAWGTQYTSHRFQALLHSHAAVQTFSDSGKSHCSV